MKLLSKIALVGAALAASTGAYADVVPPSGGIGQAVLFVKNEVTGAVYARGLDLNADQVVTQAAIVGDTYTGVLTTPDLSLSFALSGPIGPDANLTQFLSAAGSTFSWAVMLADSSGSIGLGDKRAYTTSVGTIATPSNSVLNQGVVAFNTLIGTLNSVLPDSGDNSTQLNGLWDQDGQPLGSQADLWFNAAMGVNNKVALGQTAGFYLLSTAGATLSTAARQYRLGELNLSSTGILTSVAEVPLPPAAWLLGSALAGFAGLRRRRAEAVAKA